MLENIFEEVKLNFLFYRNAVYLSFCQAISMSMIILIISSGSSVGDIFGVPEVFGTVPVSLSTLGGALSMIPASYILARYGRKSGFLIGAFLGLFSCFLIAFGLVLKSYFIVLTGYAFLGCLISFSSYFRFAVTDGAPDNLVGRGVSIVLFGGIASSVIGANASIVAGSIDFGAPFMGTPITMSVLVLVMVIFLCLYKETGKDSIKMINLAGFKKLARSDSFIRIMFLGVIGYSIMSLIMNAMPMSMRQYGFGINEISYIMGAHFFFMFFPSVFTGYLIDRYGASRIVVIGLFCYLACFCASLVSQSFYGFMIALVLLGVGWNFTFIPATSLLTLKIPLLYRREAEGVNDTVVNISNVTASFLAGVLVSIFGWKGLAVVGLTIVVIVLAIIIFPRARIHSEIA